jgi:hypothetical protein
MSHHSAFLGEAFYVLSFARKETLGDEQGEIGILRTRLLEHCIKLVLHFLPDGIAVRLDDHATAHGRLLGQVGFHDKVIIPLAVVVSPLCEIFKFFCHFVLYFMIIQILGAKLQKNLQSYDMIGVLF